MNYKDEALLYKDIEDKTYIVVEDFAYDGFFATDEERDDIESGVLQAYTVIEYKKCSCCGELSPTGVSHYRVEKTSEEALDKGINLIRLYGQM